MNYPVTINTYELGEDFTYPALGVVTISIWNNTLTTLITEATTDNNGLAAVSIPGGTYRIFGYKQGYTLLTNNGVTATINSATAVVFTFAAVPNLDVPAKSCVLSGQVKTVAGNPLAAAKIIIELTKSPQTSSGAVLDRAKYTLYTGDDGYFSTVLAGDLHITVTIPSARFKASGHLPIEGRINILELDRAQKY